MLRSGLAVAAPAKINLALHVTGQRPDGYHLLDSLVVFADIGDRVTIAPADRLSLEACGPFASHAPCDQSDLAWRAAEAFFDHAGLSPAVAIRVEKNIPAGAGLGGGSADAAAVLGGLNRLLGNGASSDRLTALGVTLGADVPMCLAGTALRARGIGEQLESVADWPILPLLLVWPGRPVSTAAAFAGLARKDNPPLPPQPVSRGLADVVGWLRSCRNDLEAPARALVPEIGAVLDALRGAEGCRLARMSGSGSACFGLFPTIEAAQCANQILAVKRPGWWSIATSAR